MKQDIRFVDLKTGNTFDGAHPYIFWFDGEHSINLSYSQPICFISNSKDISVSIEDNSIFSLVNTSQLTTENQESIHDFIYYNIEKLKTTSIQSIGVKHHNYYVHMIYVLATTDTEGEYLIDLNIDKHTYRLGCDFYANDDELTVNLMNNGIEIPTMVQKALYDINIHEEKVDNITINRKWKELLSNYWNTLANKGSYKSLFNSLKWFEYGDKLKLYEVWRNLDTNKYFEQEITQMLSKSYIDSLEGFAKTTYMALGYALNEHALSDDGKIILDYEGNPELKQITSKWSIQDLSLKLCMLGNFYETYFMPIHLDLLHSTIENIVYTSPFKVNTGHVVNREDFVYHYEDMNCNVENNSIYKLGLVECYVGPDTMFSAKHDDGVIVGVQKTIPKITGSDEDLRQYLSQLYKEVGSIVDFKFTIPDANTQIKRETLVFKTWNGKNWVYKSIVEHKLFKNEIVFSLLCPIEGEYEVRLMLECTNNKVYTKQVKFNILDTEHTSINVYRIQNYGTLVGHKLGQPNQMNDYITSRRKITLNTPITGMQYIPSYTGQPYINKQWVHKGVCLNHLLIYKNCDNIANTYLNQNYFLLKRPTTAGDYLICVSKQYGFQPNLKREPQENIYRKDYIFVPEFHTLVPLVTDERNINDYKVTDMDALCVIPELSYGKSIEEYDWEFINTSRPDLDPIQLSCVKEPFIAPTQKSFLPDGYYTIVFKYRLTGEDKINKVTLDSAFIKV